MAIGAVALTACVPGSPFPPAPSTGAASPVSSSTGQPISGASGIVSNSSASLAGTITGPSWLVSNNAGGLVSNNAGGYRISALQTGPAQRAVVYLTTPSEQFYAGPDGKALFTVTDDQGNYSFKVAPAGVPVIVTVLLPNNRRLVGYLNPAKGANTLNVDVATTLATEYLRDQARLAHKDMGGYANFATAFPNILNLTESLVAGGALRVKQSAVDTTGVIDFGVNVIPTMRNEYVRSFASSNQPLSDAWKQLLGYRPLLIEDLDVGIPVGYTTLAVAAGAGTSRNALYAAANNPYNLGIWALTPNGTGSSTASLLVTARSHGVSYIGGMVASDSLLFLGVPGAGEIEMSTALTNQSLLIDTGTGATGSAFVSSNSGYDLPNFSGTADAYDVDAQGAYLYTVSVKTNQVFRYQLDPLGNAINVDLIAGNPSNAPALPSFFTGDGVATGSKVALNYPTAVAFHNEGGHPYLYFADCDNQRIRKADLAASPSFPTSTFLGSCNTVYGNEIKPPGPNEDGKAAGSTFADIDDPAGVPAAQASFAFPHKLLFDAAGHLFIADSDHRRVRMYDPATNRVYTIAGTDDPNALPVTGDSRRCGLGEVSSITVDASGSLIIADVRSNLLHRIRLPFGL